ncbi:MAG: 4Fe-4S binding protein [Lentisphaeria bacterium]|nr:4Fe-4S binding protein [Lentisphaeria bacterium]
MRPLRTILPSLATAFAAQASDRFPKPDFEAAYQPPAEVWPGAGTALGEAIDVALLAAALGLAAHLALGRRSRRGIAVLSVVCLAYFGFWRRGCLCAVGAIQPVAEALFRGTELPLATAAIFLLPLIFALFFGRVFCAAVCPLGAIQDLVAWRPQRLSRWLASPLTLVPPIYLALALLLAGTGSAYVICRFDPFVPLFRLSGNLHGILAGICLLLLGVVLARPYCRFLCPYGVLLGWFSRFSWRHLTITPEECIRCRLCAESCPFDAILPPQPAAAPEPLPTAVRRLGRILVACPLIVLAGGWGFARAGIPLARLHSDTRLLEQIALEEAGMAVPSVESDAFRRSGRLPDELRQSVAGRRRALGRGGWWVGMAVGVVFAARLLGASVRRRRDGYEPDRLHCLSCGRCFRACPVEHARLRRKAATEE